MAPERGLSTKAHALQRAFLKKTKTAIALIFPHGEIQPSSPVPHLIRSNVPPSDSEVSLIHSTILKAELDSSLIQFEKVMRRHYTGHPQIEPRNPGHKAFIAVHQTALSPWRRLPTELLEPIFLAVMEAEIARCSLSIPIVSQVCKLWRDVSFLVPALWSNITLDLQRKTSTPKSRLLKYILQRSGQHSLRVCIMATSQQKIAHPALQKLFEQSNRWSSAIIHTSAPNVDTFQKLRGRLSSLRSLELFACGDSAFGSAIHTGFEIAPLLREVSIHGEWKRAKFVIPWNQLTYYEDTRQKRGTKKGPLRLLTSVKELNIIWTSSHSDPYTDKITLNQLTRLDVTFVAHAGILNRLILPGIEELTIRDYGSDPIPHVKAMLSRSWFSLSPPGISLRKFTCHDANYTKSKDLTVLFSYFPQLEFLDVSISFIKDMRRMLIVPNSSPVVPNLQFLRFQVAGSICDYASTIHDLAQNRCEWNDKKRPSSNSPSKTYTRVRRLTSFTITFKDAFKGYEDREFLERSSNVDSADAALQLMGTWVQRLRDLLSEELGASKVSVDLKQLQDLDEIFSTIENFPVRDVRNLYASSLHLILNRIRTEPASNIPGNEKHEFQGRAARILDTWAPLLSEDLSNRLWALKGSHSLVYVPKDDSLRSSESLEDLKIIYGL